MTDTAADALLALPLNDRVALLSGADAWHTRAAAGHPAVLMTDGPHGLRKQPDLADAMGLDVSEPATCFPPAATLANSWDPGLLDAVGTALGVEAAAAGVALLLGPGLNLKRHPCGGRNFEYFSEDPLLSGRLAAAMVAGIQRRGVGACIKHFAANNQEFHRLVVDAVIPERTLRELYLAGFEEVVRTRQPWAVMAAYNSVNGTRCTEHHRLLTTILRDEWGFDGLVVSDWGAVADRVAGVHAGMDLEMPGSGGAFDADVVDAVHRGTLAEADVNRSAARVLALAARARRGPAPAPGLDAHHDLARRAAAAGTVLLTNDGVLPLAPAGRIAVIGAFAERPRYQGYGSSLVNPTRLDPALAAITAAVGDAGAVTYAPGYDAQDPQPDQALIDQAVAVAGDADAVVVLVGLPDSHEAEGFDRAHLRLPAQHDRLVAAVCAANPRTVVALSHGGALELPWRERPAAILAGYLGGQAGGSALADVLFGVTEPGGRLAETWPLRLSDVPSDAFFPGVARQVEYREHLYVGYRYFTTADVAVAFPFGHGLGYTTFEWLEAELDTDSLSAGAPLTLSVTVHNTGTRAGSDVVQVYVADDAGTVEGPARELCGFAKVHLAPGVRQRVTITVPPRAFEYYDTATGRWRTAPGRYRVELAASSTDVRVSLPVVVTGPEVPAQRRRAELIAADDADFEALLGRPLPTPVPTRPFTRDTTVGQLRASRVGRVLSAAVHRAAKPRFEAMAGGDAGRIPGLTRTLDEMPLRGVVLMAAGPAAWPVLDATLDVLNGHGLAALRSSPHRLLTLWRALRPH